MDLLGTWDTMWERMWDPDSAVQKVVSEKMYAAAVKEHALTKSDNDDVVGALKTGWTGCFNNEEYNDAREYLKNVINAHKLQLPIASEAVIDDARTKLHTLNDTWHESRFCARYPSK